APASRPRRRRTKPCARRQTKAGSKWWLTFTRTTTTAPSHGTSTPRTRSSSGSARNNGFGVGIARASARARGAGRSEPHEGLLSRRLVGESGSPSRPLRSPRGSESGGERAECAHGHDLRERGRCRRGRRLVSAHRSRFPATGGMARRLGATTHLVGSEGKSTAGSTGVGHPEKLTDLFVLETRLSLNPAKEQKPIPN